MHVRRLGRIVPSSLLVALVAAVAACSSSSEPAPLPVVGPVGAAPVDVPPSHGEAVALEEVLAAGLEVDILSSLEMARLPLESFSGSAVLQYLVFTTPHPVGDPLDFVAGYDAAKAVEVGATVQIVGARTDEAPRSVGVSSGKPLEALARTIAAVGGRAHIRRLVSSSPTTPLVEDDRGRFFAFGAIEALPDESVAQLRSADEEYRKALASASPAELATLKAAWGAPLSRAGRYAPADFERPDGNLDLAKVASALREQRYAETRDKRVLGLDAARGLVADDDIGGTPSSPAAPTIKPQDFSEEKGDKCTSYFLWWCNEMSHWERGRYSATTIASPHHQEAHPKKKMPIGTSALPLGYKDAPYSGCGPESFAGMVWRRWVMNDANFGADRAALAPVPWDDSNSTLGETINALAANGAADTMGTAWVGGGGYTLPWNYTPGANKWLEKRTHLRVGDHVSYLLANRSAGALAAKAKILRRIIGEERGPIVAGGFIGGSGFLGLGPLYNVANYHYNGAFAYRIKWKKNGSRYDVADVIVTLDFDTRSAKDDGGHGLSEGEISLADARHWYSGLWFFKDDLDRPGPRRADSCAGRPDGVYCLSSLSSGAIHCSGGSIAKGAIACGIGTKCVGPNGPGAASVCK
jgi:hypothetical protein